MYTHVISKKSVQCAREGYDRALLGMVGQSEAVRQSMEYILIDQILLIRRYRTDRIGPGVPNSCITTNTPRNTHARCRVDVVGGGLDDLPHSAPRHHAIRQVPLPLPEICRGRSTGWKSWRTRPGDRSVASAHAHDVGRHRCLVPARIVHPLVLPLPLRATTPPARPLVRSRSRLPGAGRGPGPPRPHLRALGPPGAAGGGASPERAQRRTPRLTAWSVSEICSGLY